MKRTRKGFTLVELLITVAILAVLSTAMMMSVKDATPTAQATRVGSDFKAFATAVNLYFYDSKDVTPTQEYFVNHSDDYLSGGKLKNYTITSDDSGKWY